jgi:hypothetical protein
MEATTRSRARLWWLGSTSAVVISLLLIFVGVLGVWNEIRYQGCVARIDQQKLVAVTQDPRNPAPVELNCERVPFQ